MNTLWHFSYQEWMDCPASVLQAGKAKLIRKKRLDSRQQLMLVWIEFFLNLAPPQTSQTTRPHHFWCDKRPEALPSTAIPNDPWK